MLTFAPFAPAANAAGDPGVDSEIDYAGVFNGTNGYASRPDSDGKHDISGDLTFEAWIYPSSTSGVLIAKDNSYAIELMNLEIKYALAGAGSAWAWNSTGVYLKQNEWQHVAFTKSGNTGKLYVNGYQLWSATDASKLPSSMNQNNNSFGLGSWTLANGAPSGEYFTGKLDEVRVWSVARTANDVFLNMSNKDILSASGLVSNYDFNEGTGTTIYDRAVAGADLSAPNLTFADVKTTSTVSGDVVLTFPRSYLPGAGGWTAPNGLNFRALLVGGGGGGGAWIGAGAGAGGFREISSLNLTVGSTHSVRVGQGGVGAYFTLINSQGSHSDSANWNTRNPTSGQTSSFGTSYSVPGGGTGAHFLRELTVPPTSGGSGGGGTFYSPGGFNFGEAQDAEGAAAGLYGNAGGDGAGIGDAAAVTADYGLATGGGGGASSAGQPAQSNSLSGAGGAGSSSTILTTALATSLGIGEVSSGNVYFAGGGGGSLHGDGTHTFSAAQGGVGGGGDGSVVSGAWPASISGQSGLANTGGGGGGAANFVDKVSIGGFGGSGVVVIRYTPASTLTFVSDASAVSPITVATGTAANKPTDPTTSAESLFLGWATTQGDASTIISWPYTVSSSQTLYAIWSSSPGLKSEADYAMDFSIGSNILTIPSSTALDRGASSSLLVSAWIKADSVEATGQNVIFTRDQSYCLRLANGEFVIDYRNGATWTNGPYTGVKMPVGQWVHVAMFMTSSAYQLYVNGSLASSIASGHQDASQPLLLGAYAGTPPALGFDGQIDDLRVWVGKSASDIPAEMYSRPDTSAAGLRGYWDFNEPSGQQVYNRDVSGTLAGSGTFTGTASRIDVKQASTTNGTTTLKFPRTYLSGVGGWKVPATVTSADALVIGGGGSGGASIGGGGGAGEFFEKQGLSVTGGSVMTVKVGQGAFASSANGTSSALGATEMLGGGGGGIDSTAGPSSGTASGGGGGFISAGVTPATRTVQGVSTYQNGGGAGSQGGCLAARGGGGGGAGSAGTAGPNSINGPSGAGGDGRQSDITGTYLAAGGGGGFNTDAVQACGTPGTGTAGPGGIGGGGSGVLLTYVPANSDGAAGTGSGGGGGSNTGAFGRGGSGLVAVRYTVATTPVIASQPQSLSVNPGSAAAFTVSATGNGTLSYQWQSSTDGTNWLDVGSNQNTYTTSNLTINDTGLRIRVVVTNTLNGTSSLTSSVAVATVSGVTLTTGACSAMVNSSVGVTVKESANGGCLVEFTNTGSNKFFVPQTVTSIRALLVGGGGGGGSASLTNGRGGGGGGGGGAANMLVDIPVSANQEISFSIGAGGAGGVNANGATGSSTTLTAASTNYVVPGGAGGAVATTTGGAGGVGGAGNGSTVRNGATAGAGAIHPADQTWRQPQKGNACTSRTLLFSSLYNYCVGGAGGGGNREVSTNSFFNYGAGSIPYSGTNKVSGGTGGYHNGTAPVAATAGTANTGGGGGGGSYDSTSNTFRSGGNGSNGLVVFTFSPGAGAISLSSVADFSFSNTTKTITLTKDNTTNDVTWTSSNTAICTVTGTATSASVTPVTAGTCEITASLAANAPYAKGSAVTSFRIDKITRTAPTWVSNAINIPFGGTYDLRTNITSPGQLTYTFTTSGTANSCSVSGYTLTVGAVGDTCDVSMTLVGDSIYSDVAGATALSVTVTRIAQSALVITSGDQMNVAQSFVVSAAGGSGTGALTYHVSNAGGTGCQINSSTGEITGTTAAGDCVVYAERAASTNYNSVTSSSQTITVSKINQVLSWVSNPQATVLAGDQYVVQATSSGQLAPSYSIVSGLCSIAQSTVTFTGSGDCVIRAAQAGSTGYWPAQSITQTVSVGKINQTMTFAPIANKSWGSLAFSINATASSTLAVSYSENVQTTNDACDVSFVGIVTINNIGTCAITATQAGDSAYTSVSITQVFEVTPNPAGAPFIGSISFGDRQLTASFFAPSYLGGGDIAAYELRAYKKFDNSLVAKNSGCIAQPGPNQSCTVIGLENGELYYLKVAAITQAGLGQFSAASGEIVPGSNPEAVSSLTAIEGDGQLTLNWTPAASLGGGNFDQYRIFWRTPGGSYQANGSPGATVADRNATTYTITGLQNGVAYDVKITTVTSINTLEMQANTAEVRQTPFTVPDAPGAVAALDNGTSILVAWQAPVFDGGNAVSQYVVTKDGVTVCSINTASSTSCELQKTGTGTSTIVVKAGNDAGLSQGTQVTFTIAALPGNNNSSNSNTSSTKPQLTPLDAAREIKRAGSITLGGSHLLQVKKVLVGGVEAGFTVNSDNQITITIPVGAKLGSATISLIGDFGTASIAGILSVIDETKAIASKVTIGTFGGYVAVYTKNLDGKRLSVKIGKKWRVISSLKGDFTVTLKKIGRGKKIQTKVFVDRKATKTRKLTVK
jgi:hypothetical protein